MWSTFDVASVLFAMAAVIGLANARWFGLPPTIALLLGALGASLAILAVSAVLPEVGLAARLEARLIHADLPRVLLDGVLALLLFAASLQLDLRELRRRAMPVLLLATAGVAISMLVFGGGIWLVLNLAGLAIPLAWCLVLGAVLAPTDAVAVDQLLHRVRVPGRLRSLIAGESLFNDGAAVVLFFAALAIAGGEAEGIGHGRLLVELLASVVGGAVVGTLLGILASLGMRIAQDRALAVTISLALVLAAYRMAVALDLSGPIAVAVAGLVLCNWRAAAGAAAARLKELKDFWSTLDEIVNALLFLLMGFELLAIPLRAAGLAPILAAIPLALAARLVSVAIPLMLRGRSEESRPVAIAVLTWTGLRGGISLALVLTLPDNAWRDVLTAICYAVVIFSVVVQGLSTPRVVAALYKSKNSEGAREEDGAEADRDAVALGDGAAPAGRDGAVAREERRDDHRGGI